jgi:hypothetical protein
MEAQMDLRDIEAAIHETGMAPRGAIHPRPEDDVPDVVHGQPTGTVVLIGDAGPAMWQSFSAARDPSGDRLDAWTFDVVDDLADRLRADALYPFTRPHLPFQRWARRAGPNHVSPLRILIHPDYGLWHGFRAALAFAETLDLPPPDDRPSPCDSCPDKPCLGACPVDAFSTDGYDVPACTAHLRSRKGRACMSGGCLARRACPEGRDFAYEPARAQFHLAAFLHRRGDGRYPATRR